ncbi:MAG: histidine phosphatase family protein [Erythrobacter sp.]|nr:histidine phosphatase family protein [Erythrobacter sp.]
MKRLALLRHAKSDWDDMALRDFDRGLNARGRRGAELMARHITDHGIAWDLVLASPAERVRCTLAASRLQVPVRFEEALYLADGSTLMNHVQRVGDSHESVMVAAHNPGLQELALMLVAEENENLLFAEVMKKFPTCAFAVLELDIDSWAVIAPGCGRLVHFARPRDLDPELGPVSIG